MLRKTVYHAACDIVRAPTADAWAYLKAHLQPLDVVWGDALPPKMLLSAHGDDASFEDAIARHRAASGCGADVADVFGDAQAAALLAGAPKAGRTTAFDPLDAARLAEAYAWTPWEAFRLAALWAMRGATTRGLPLSPSQL